MQAQSDMMASSSGGPTYIQTIKKIYQTENGLRGFYRGWFPPLVGSIIFRSLQFSVYEVFYTFAEKYPATHELIPCSGGIQYRIVLGGIVSGIARAVFECPFEFVKVN